MESEKDMPNGMKEEKDDQKVKKKTKTNDGLKKNKKRQDKPVSDVISEVRDGSEENSDLEEENGFWMPPMGQRWDNDDGGDRWGSSTESGAESDDGDVKEPEESETEEAKQEAGKLSNRTKRLSLEVGPSSFASRKKKKKTEAS